MKEPNPELYAQWQGKLGGDGLAFHWRFRLLDEAAPRENHRVPMSAECQMTRSKQERC